jgi:hypothetical protein
MNAQQVQQLANNTYLYVDENAYQRVDASKCHPLRFKNVKQAREAIADKDTLELIQAIAAIKPTPGVPYITSEINHAVVAFSGTGQLVIGQ